LAAKTSVLHCLMMSHRGDLLARYQVLLKSHHDYVQYADSQLRGLQEKCSAYQGLESQVSDSRSRLLTFMTSSLLLMLLLLKPRLKVNTGRKRLNLFPRTLIILLLRLLVFPLF
ncbi:hypothetical protein Tco_0504541, partial [Tanacetum coccineum]